MSPNITSCIQADQAIAAREHALAQFEHQAQVNL